MKNYKFALLGALLFAVVAIGARQGTGSVSVVNDPKPQHFVNGLFIGTEAKDPLSTTINKQAYHLCATKIHDFAALGNIMAPGTTACEESSALTITGCGFGDRLSMGIDQAYVNAFGQIVPYVSAANTVKIVACANGITDGGSFDMPDASYTICCDG
jgi:hypothetical protein